MMHGPKAGPHNYATGLVQKMEGLYEIRRYYQGDRV